MANNFLDELVDGLGDDDFTSALRELISLLADLAGILALFQVTTAATIPAMATFGLTIVPIILSITLLVLALSALGYSIGFIIEKLPEFMGSLSGVGELIDSVFGGIADVLVATFDAIIVAISTVFEGIASIISPVIEGITTTISNVLSVFMGVFQAVLDFITNVFFAAWSAAWDAVVGIFSSIIGGISGVFQRVWDFILGIFNSGGKIFTGIAEGIAGVFKTIVNGLIGGINEVISFPFKTINGLLNEIRAFDIPIVGKPFKGLWGKNPLPVPKIPEMLAKGGTLTQGIAMVGEAGPELLLQQGNRTTVAPLTRGGGADPVNIIDYEKLSQIIVRTFVNATNGLSVKMDRREFGKLVSEVSR